MGFGSYVLEDAIMNGGLQGDTAILYAKGVYLYHGGTPEDFDSMTYDDIQMMLLAYTGDKKRDLKDMSKMLYQMFGGGQDA